MNDRAKVKSTLILVSLYLMNQWIRAIHLIASGQFMVYKYCGDMRVSRYIFIGCEYGLDLLSKKYILFNSNEQNAHPLSMHTLLRKAFNLANYRSLTQHTIYTLLYQLYSMSALLQEAALTATTSTTCGSLLPQLQLHLCADGSLLPPSGATTSSHVQLSTRRLPCLDDGECHRAPSWILPIACSLHTTSLRQGPHIASHTESPCSF